MPGSEINFYIDPSRLRANSNRLQELSPPGESERWRDACDRLIHELETHPSPDLQLQRWYEVHTPSEPASFDADLVSMWGYCVALFELEFPPRPPGE